MMDEIIVSIATKSDKPQLLEFFKHYSNPEILESRIDCYLSHNSTILAKDGGKIVGTLQWHIKEDPSCGIVEFEEFHVLESHRGKGIGSALLEKGIQSVKDTFSELGIEPRRIFAFVGTQHDAARRVFEKSGFEQISEVGNLLSDSEIDLIYCLEI
ncbi:MAG: GNAT family N-acetyltransferase [Thermoplasmata archaeon]|nr:GNAT family N-acetyltransferase [Thermoplasmata archaeon]